MSTPTITWDDIFTSHMSDEALEYAAGTPESVQAGASLYSSYNASGCTC
jgi:hypothetical protein